MNKIYLGIGVVAVTIFATFVLVSRQTTHSRTTVSQSTNEKIYVALEGDGKVAIIDAANNQVLRKIDLTEEKDGGTVEYMAHNVQVAPDGNSVAVTANVNDNSMQMQMGSDSQKGMNMSGGLPDELVVIDPKTDSITKRIPIEPEAHLAHVVFEPDNKTVWVTLQQNDKVDEIDLATGQVMKSVTLPVKSGPHGLRLTPDGSRAFVALMGNGVALLNTNAGTLEIKQEPGAAVQAAVTPDGAYAFTSIYDTKQVAWFSLKDDAQGLINLPDGAKGPVQLYPTPDSRYLYVADQGYYFNQPNGNEVYRIDIANKKVDTSVTGGSAPHGVVVSKDGTRVYVTNLLSNDVSVIDTSTNKEVARIPVGTMPNGISIWNDKLGGTP